MRPGRLDRILYVGAPDAATRKEIFRIRLASMAIEPGIDIDKLALIVSFSLLTSPRSFDRPMDALEPKLPRFVKTRHLQL